MPSRDRLSVPIGVVVIAAGLSLVIGQQRFRLMETGVSAWALRALRLRPASSLGTNVIFPLGGRWVGFSLTLACTAALLMVPFFLITGGTLLLHRVDLRRALTALAVTCAIIFVVNQLRLFVIAGSMVLWGFRTGYERSHILLGTVLSTVGVIAGIILFIRLLIDTPARPRRVGA